MSAIIPKTVYIITGYTEDENYSFEQKKEYSILAENFCSRKGYAPYVSQLQMGHVPMKGLQPNDCPKKFEVLSAAGAISKAKAWAQRADEIWLMTDLNVSPRAEELAKELSERFKKPLKKVSIIEQGKDLVINPYIGNIAKAVETLKNGTGIFAAVAVKN